MKKKNGGFTLIELLIAITVLSIMAGVLLQTFVVGGRLNTKARVEERIQDMARKTMEEMKGYSFEALGKIAKEASDAGGKEVSISGTDYRFAEREDGKWELTALYRRDGKTAGNKKADYLLQVVADRQPYSEENDSTVYSVNQFEMPNIADVSSFRNVVLEPEAAFREEELLVEELLVKVNPQEEEDEEDGADNSASADDGNSSADGGEDSGDGEEELYGEKDIARYLSVHVKEEGETLAVDVRLIYTVADSSDALSVPSSPDFETDLTVEKEILNVKKRIVADEKTGDALNRIYLFLPPAPPYKRLFISGDTDGEKSYEIYVVSHQPDFVKNDIVISSKGETENLMEEKKTWFSLYTNLEQEKPVSFLEAEDRLYHLTVTVYRAVYPEGGEGTEPDPGEELLTLDSTKVK